MKKIFFVLVLTLALAGQAWGLTDAEYYELVKTSPEFKAADAQLNAVWKEAKAKLPAREYQFLVDDQRFWLERVREYLVKALEKKGVPRPAALAIATRFRAEKIQKYTADGWRKRMSVNGILYPAQEPSIFKIGVPSKREYELDFVTIASTEGNWMTVLNGLCEIYNNCTITGTMNIEGDIFIYVDESRPVGRNLTYNDSRKEKNNPTWGESSQHERRLRDTLEQIDKMSEDLMQ